MEQQRPECRAKKKGQQPDGESARRQAGQLGIASLFIQRRAGVSALGSVHGASRRPFRFWRGAAQPRRNRDRGLVPVSPCALGWGPSTQAPA